MFHQPLKKKKGEEQEEEEGEKIPRKTNNFLLATKKFIHGPKSFNKSSKNSATDLHR